MQERRQIGLDNSAFNGRVRSYRPSVHRASRPIVASSPPQISDIKLVKPAPKPVAHNVNSPFVASTPRPVPNTRIVSSTSKPALPRQTRSFVLTRQVVQKKKRKLPHASDKTRVSVMLVTMAMLVFMTGSYVSLMSWRTNKAVTAQVAVLSKQDDNEEASFSVPDETESSDESLTSYHVANELPRLLSISKLGVKAKVKRVGVKPNNELKAPANIFDVGWYEGSAKPGESGAILLDGHVAGPTKPGVFYRLNNLTKGDPIEIERGDGKKITYRVVKSEVYDYEAVDMAAALQSAEANKQGLNLITCSGRFDVRTNKYEQRLVVFAVRE